MIELSKIGEFIEKCRADGYVYNNGSKYCVIVWKTRLLTMERTIAAIYPTLYDFNLKVAQLVEGIDKMHGIDFQIWEFD